MGYKGFVDRLDREVVAGWAVNSDNLEERIEVDIAVRGKVVKTVVCEVLREDLRGAYGDGLHGFAHRFSKPLTDDQVPAVNVIIAGTQRRLPTQGMNYIGHVDRMDREAVAGWAANFSNSSERVDVAILVNGHLESVVPCKEFRQDLSDGGYGDGRHGFSYRFKDALCAEGAHRVVVVFARTGAQVANGSGFFPGGASSQGMIPVLVTGGPRSGTTLLMQRLSSSPQICVAKGYPYETRLIAYYAKALKNLTSHANLNLFPVESIDFESRTVGPNQYFDGERYWSEYCDTGMFLEHFAGSIPLELNKKFSEFTKQYYKIIAHHTGKKECIYFAEKNLEFVQYTRSFAMSINPATKEIILLRDPRDLYLSYRSYFKSSNADALKATRETCENTLRSHERRTSNTIFLRYEDLVLEPELASRCLTELLRVSLPPPDGKYEESLFQTHGTSASPTNSIGKWRKQIGESEASALKRECGNFLEMFGYDKEVW